MLHKKRLDTLYSTQGVPRDTSQYSRRSLNFSTQLEKSPVFPTSSRDEGRFPCFNLRGILTFPLHHKRSPVSLFETREEPYNSCHK